VRLPLGSGVGANLSVILYGLALIVIVQRLPRGVVPTLFGENVRGRLEGGGFLKRITLRKLPTPEPRPLERAAPQERIPAVALGGSQARNR
jgi:hypothetical protein